MSFKQATKKESKLRLLVTAGSGWGKTYTSLRIATGIKNFLQEKGKKEITIGLIDTERGSASKYGDRFSFVVSELTQPTIENYIKRIDEAAKNNVDILILDSTSHAWKELNQMVEDLAAKKFHYNTFRAWAVGTPLQNKFIESILSYPGHVIATARLKMSYEIQEQNGKKIPVKLGLTPEQGKGLEYEFDLHANLNENHIAFIEKDRTGKFHKQYIEEPGEDFGEQLAEWLSDGLSFDEVKRLAIEEIGKANSLDELMNLWNDNRDLQKDKDYLTAMTARKKELLEKKKECTQTPPD